MRINFVLTGILILGLIGVLMLGFGITGYVTNDGYIKPICSSNSECISPEVCCRFYQDNSGVCEDVSMCSSITKLTREQVLQSENPENFKEKPRNEPFSQQIFFGSLILVVFLILLYAYSHSRRIKKNEVKKKISSVKKSRVVKKKGKRK